MRNIIRIVAALALLALPAMSRAQHIVNDTIIPERIVVKSSQFGISTLGNLDTYLGDHEYNGLGLEFSHENFRDARTGNYLWKFQTQLNSTVGFASLGRSTQLAAMVAYRWSGYHSFGISDRLKLLAGAQIQAEGGALYIPGNGNSPVSAKLRTALAASGMAIYHFPVKGYDWVARLQLDIPLVGIMFAPEFGQSYYEIFGLGKFDNAIKFSHPFNSPSWRHTLSIDIPLRYKRHSTTLRLSYSGDIYQSDINETRCHIYRHAFTFGFVKTIFKVKQENSIKRYSPY